MDLSSLFTADASGKHPSPAKVVKRDFAPHEAVPRGGNDGVYSIQPAPATPPAPANGASATQAPAVAAHTASFNTVSQSALSKAAELPLEPVSIEKKKEPKEESKEPKEPKEEKKEVNVEKKGANEAPQGAASFASGGLAELKEYVAGIERSFKEELAARDRVIRKLELAIEKFTSTDDD